MDLAGYIDDETEEDNLTKQMKALFQTLPDWRQVEVLAYLRLVTHFTDSPDITYVLKHVSRMRERYFISDPLDDFWLDLWDDLEDNDEMILAQEFLKLGLKSLEARLRETEEVS